MLHLLHELEEDPEMRLLASCVYHLAELFNKMEREPRFLQQDAADRMKQLIDFSTTSYVRMAKRMVGAKIMMFPLKPKLHAMQELAYWTAVDRVNPRSYHTFKDEDLNGRIV
ncbi:Ogfr, partial [Symbiodinium sp. CCMP2592]